MRLSLRLRLSERVFRYYFVELSREVVIMFLQKQKHKKNLLFLSFSHNGICGV